MPLQTLANGLSIEYVLIKGDEAKSCIVFLHEGLGSVSMWRDFPKALCDALGCPGLVYSRPGYGQSTPRRLNDHWPPNFMHTQAWEVLPALLPSLNITNPVLFGHSDGASIALLHAAKFPVRAVVALAPHLFVEEMAVTSIAQAKLAYESGDLKPKLARHHADADSAFYGWNAAWLSAEFKSWNIETDVAQIRCPVLAVQGEQDEYGTFAQVDRIAQLCPANTQLLKFQNCGHSPHRDQPGLLTASVQDFLCLLLNKEQ